MRNRLVHTCMCWLRIRRGVLAVEVSMSQGSHPHMRQPEPRPPVLGMRSNSNLTVKIIGNSVWVTQRAAGVPGIPFIWPTWTYLLKITLALTSSTGQQLEMHQGHMERNNVWFHGEGWRGSTLYHFVHLLSPPNRGVPSSFAEPSSYSAVRCQI